MRQKSVCSALERGVVQAVIVLRIATKLHHIVHALAIRSYNNSPSRSTYTKQSVYSYFGGAITPKLPHLHIQTSVLPCIQFMSALAFSLLSALLPTLCLDVYYDSRTNSRLFIPELEVICFRCHPIHATVG